MPSDRLSRQAVIDRALTLADAEGLEAVTIRRLATELGVTPMALYWHVKNKDELLAALADHLVAALVADLDAARPWNERLRTLVGALVEQARAHPYLATLLPVVARNPTEEYYRAAEVMIGLLTEAGFTIGQADQITTQLILGATALVSCEPLGADPADEDAAERRRRQRLALERLRPDHFPNLAALAATLTAPPDLDAHYTFGVDLLLASVETLAPVTGRRSSPAPP